MKHSTTLSVGMWSVVKMALTQCKQLVATKRLDVLTAYLVSSCCILSASYFVCVYQCVNAVYSRLGEKQACNCVSLNLPTVVCLAIVDWELVLKLKLRHCWGIRPRHWYILQTSEVFGWNTLGHWEQRCFKMFDKTKVSLTEQWSDRKHECGGGISTGQLQSHLLIAPNL